MKRTKLITLIFSCMLLLAGHGAVFAGSDVMDQPLDGSSVELFEQGVEKVKAEATGEEYAKLSSALKYLLYYDLSVGHNKEKLYKKLDGKTPDEVIAKTAR